MGHLAPTTHHMVWAQPGSQFDYQTLKNHPVTMDWPLATMPHLIGAARCSLNAKSPLWGCPLLGLNIVPAGDHGR